MVEGPRRSFSIKPQRPPPPQCACKVSRNWSRTYGVLGAFHKLYLSIATAGFLQGSNLHIISPDVVNMRVCRDISLCRRYSDNLPLPLVF